MEYRSCGAPLTGMRVAFITNMCTYYVRPLLEELSRRWDADFMFFSVGTERYLSRAMNHDPGDIPTVPLRLRTIRGAVYASGLSEQLANGRYDVVVKCLNGKLIVPQTYFAARRAGVPFVLWTGMWDHPTTLFHSITRSAVVSLYRKANAVVGYGEHVRRYLVEECGVQPSRAFAAGQAVDGARFAAARDIAEAGPVALYVGQLEPIKGIGDLCAAFRSLPDPSFRLRLVGTGSLAGWVEEQSRLDLRIEPAGYCTQDELPDEYGRARCVVLPSVQTKFGRETWGLVVNEAMHAGRPIVASDAVGAAAGGLAVDGRNGYVVPQGDPSALAAALGRLLGDTEQAISMGARAAMDVERFSYGAMADAFEAACVTAVANSR